MIIDDEQASIAEMQRHIESIPAVQLCATLDDPEKAVIEIIKHQPDLVFLDIKMPGRNGFDIVEELQQTSVTPFIIFVTAFDTFAIRAIRSAAFDYLLKPVKANELALAIERIIKKRGEQKVKTDYTALLDQTRAKKIRFNITGGFVLIDPLDILFVKADWNYSEVHYKRDKFETVTLNLGAVEEMLPRDSFVRINRSTLINLRYLDRVSRKRRRCILKKEGEVYEFEIPLLRIRYLEDLL